MVEVGTGSLRVMVTFCLGLVGEGAFLVGLLAMVVRGAVWAGSVYVCVVISILSRIASDITFSLALEMALEGRREVNKSLI